MLAILLTFGSLQFVNASLAKPRWHLQRIVQRESLSLERIASGEQVFNLSSIPVAPVNIYVIDSGVRITHDEFSGKNAVYGTNVVTPRSPPSDCQGHGTHVAALAAGQFSGVAKNARIISVRILDCRGNGYCSDVLGALEWVIDNSAKRRANGERSVAVMAIGSGDSNCAPTVEATQTLWDAGVVVAAAAGNSGIDACNLFPAKNAGTIAVGATDVNDRLYSQNNVGDCIDVFAPGVDLLSAWGASSDTEERVSSGTSMAAPLVAGMAALVLGADNMLTSDEVRQILIASSSRNQILRPSGVDIMLSSPNRLAYAPWVRLFDAIPMNDGPVRKHSSLTTKQSEESIVFAVSLKLWPRTIPAMAFSVERLVSALALTAELNRSSIIARRAAGVNISKDGEEPKEVQLVFYFAIPPTLLSRSQDLLRKTLDSGELARSSKENITISSLEEAIFADVIIPTTDGEGVNRPNGDRNLVEETKKSGRSVAAIVGIVGGIAAVCVVIVLVALFVAKPRFDAVRVRQVALANAQNEVVTIPEPVHGLEP